MLPEKKEEGWGEEEEERKVGGGKEEGRRRNRRKRGMEMRRGGGGKGEGGEEEAEVPLLLLIPDFTEGRIQNQPGDTRFCFTGMAPMVSLRVGMPTKTLITGHQILFGGWPNILAL